MGCCNCSSPATEVVGGWGYCSNCYGALMAPLWGKWGNVTQGPPGVLQCRCGASWVAQGPEHCNWCHQRWEAAQQEAKQALLHPGWLQDPPPVDLDPDGAWEWVETRGGLPDAFTVEVWADALADAESQGLVSSIEVGQVWNRYHQWWTHMKRIWPERL